MKILQHYELPVILTSKELHESIVILADYH